MTTLEAIGFTAATCACVFVPSLLLFGLAVRVRHIYIAPRCTARPKDTIYNPKSPNCPKSQDRGNPIVGWYSWASGISYDELLRGVQGTGTRNNGLEGTMLRATMDGVVLLRFHAICFKVSVLAVFLGCGVILPLNWTAACFEEQQGDFTGELSAGCTVDQYNLTNYQRTTLANIPALDTADGAGDLWGVSWGELMGRLYGVVFCSWIITAYACYLTRREWVELMAMRRVYYLESDVHGQRKEEIRATLLTEVDEAEHDVETEAPEPPRRQGETNRRKKRQSRQRKRAPPKDLVNNRDPWIPHPEQRETVPNIGLYSVLVGGLPSMPQQEVEQEDLEMALGQTKKMSIDWQLALTTSFFDQCVPNQPGFSSSVAAVTIVPSATDIGRAWGKWYRAAKALRRLRYIRKRVAQLRHYDIDEDERHYDVDDDDQSVGKDDAPVPVGNLLEAPTTPTKTARRTFGSTVYTGPSRDHLRQALGSVVNEDVETNFLMTFNFGPEQTAVYSREFAQSASACCPYGCCEGRLRRARIDELLLLEQDAIAEVHEANKMLQDARNRISEGESHTGSRKKNSKGSQSPEEKLVSMSIDELGEHGASLADLQGNLRADFGVHRRKGQTDVSTEWALVNSIVQEANSNGSTRVSTRHAKDGAWKWPNLTDVRTWLGRKKKETTKLATTVPDKVVGQLTRDSTYAVVTFTSRQAAVAARQCLNDGRGTLRWEAFDKIPVPPLADAAPCALCPCRGCCRPVTMSLNGKQKSCRKYISLVLLAAIYVFYTIPITFAASLVDITRLQNIFPRLDNVDEEFAEFYSGLIQGGLFTLFFAVCPVMFKSIANFGSNARTVVEAEFSALKYYWYFMLITSFTGSSLATMVLNGWDEGLRIGSELQTVLASVASSIPTTISATWINWMIVRTLITIPLNYMLQFNTFLFSILGWKCCSRLVRGGGPGGPTPYRVYIDSGVCFLCVVALAPASPLVSLPAFFHYLYFNPLVKRNLIYVYRPKFDSGGIRWPFLFDILITSILLGQILLATMVALKRALGPAVLAALPFIPTVLFRNSVRKQFLRAYDDAALVQTSMLDGWDVNQRTSMKEREEYRGFLVDSHKASYVPVCIAGSGDVVTAEPAVVIPQDRDPTDLDMTFGVSSPDDSEHERRSSLANGKSAQYGVTMRRVTPKAGSSRGHLSRHFDFNDDGSMRFAYARKDDEEGKEQEGAL